MASRDQFLIQLVKVPPEERHEEQLGSKAKFWFKHEPHGWVLFKRGRENEDWSEKAGTELGRLLGLPCALVDLATCDGQPGIVSPSLLGPRDQLIHGNQLLLQLNPSYPGRESYNVRQHTLDAVMSALEEFDVLPWPTVDPPLPETFDAGDVFVGYLLLDAWIGNSDRHHENWAILQRDDGRFLSPSYDHASSLGRNEPDARMAGRLRGTDPRSTVEAYAHKCRSALYETPDAVHPMTTRDAFAFAVKNRATAGEYWLSRLRALDDQRASEILESIPDERCSAVHRRFASRILEINRRHLLALAPDAHE